MTTINKFRGAYAFLSNFAYSAVRLDDGVTTGVFPTVEHAFQAAKTLDVAVRERIRGASDPSYAKYMGRRVKLRADWETIKQTVMLNLLREKFKDSTLRAKLLGTGDAQLVEGNNWHDTYWGVCYGGSKCDCNNIGENHLGKLLMQVRAEIRSGGNTTNNSSPAPW